jgi:tol-pal system protein YbgF
MSRGLCVLAALAILACGCASRRAVDRLESDVGRLRSELAEIRVGQEATSRGVANFNTQLQSLDVQSLKDEIERLNRRADSAEMALSATRTKVDAMAPPASVSLAPTPDAAASSSPTSRPWASASVSPVPPPLPPAPAVMSRVPPPLPPDPAVMSPVPAPTPPNRTALAPTPPTPGPPASMMLPTAPAAPAAPANPPAPSAAAVERPRVAPPPAPTVSAARPSVKASGNPEQDYAAALATYRAREHGQAVIDFIDFIAKYPKHPLAANAQYWIGEAYWAQRDYRQALVEFEKVSEHGPAKAPDALLKIGLCYLRLGDVSRAQQAWQRVVNEYPKSEPAAMARSLIATHSSARR